MWLVPVETHKPIDLLNGHKAEPVATWLRVHPGVEVFVRDRAGAFSDAARQGGAAGDPDCGQVPPDPECQPSPRRTAARAPPAQRARGGARRSPAREASCSA